jgi:glycolate oxidase
MWQGEPSLSNRLSTDLFERRYYAEDMAAVPGLLVKPFFRTLPDAVARPHTGPEVAEAVRQAVAQNMAVVPRAAASTALFQTVPLRGGLVLDLNELAGVVSLDEARQTVTVQAGTRWLDLERALQPYGLALKSYPTSAVTSTVGGWFNTQGHGLGSLKYGSLLSQINRAEVVLPDGRIVSTTPDSEPPLAWLAGSEGTLGVVTEIELAVRSAPLVETNHLLAFVELADLQTATATLARSEPRPYTLFFSDEGYARMLAESGFEVPTTQPILLVNYQGDAADVTRGQSRLAGLPGRSLEAALALAEWQHRLYHVRVKRGGPSLLAAEMWLPVDRLAGYLAEVQAMSRKFRTPIGSYGLVVSPDQATVMSLYHCDARQSFDYTLALGLTAQLYGLGARFGGRPYGVGLWNTPYLAQIFSSRQLAEWRARKHALDPAGRFNPGKLYRAPFPLWPVVFKPGTAALALAYRWRGGRGEQSSRGQT